MCRDLPIITIDGPSGVGKGTVSRAVASRLGWHYLDSGAIYRCLAMAATAQDVALDDEEQLIQLAKKITLCFELAEGSGELSVMLNGSNVSALIGTESCGSRASKIAVLPGVRAALLEKQQNFAQKPGLVADGRDMGSVVFENAQFKFFLTASAQERANRRYKQLKEKGMSANLEKITRELIERDRRDSERSVAPLTAPSDAVIIDSSDMAVNEVIEMVMTNVS
ncbi:MAG: (d)CMP kinase [Gammaproteobacteria bacterium]|nr:MAG: (d)CMP kinase [Gammaproteobacteria bacterium]